MSKKTNALSLRLIKNKKWVSQSFFEDYNYSKLFYQDLYIQNYVKNFFEYNIHKSIVHNISIQRKEALAYVFIDYYQLEHRFKRKKRKKKKVFIKSKAFHKHRRLWWKRKKGFLKTFVSYNFRVNSLFRTNLHKLGVRPPMRRYHLLEEWYQKRRNWVGAKGYVRRGPIKRAFIFRKFLGFNRKILKRRLLKKKDKGKIINTSQPFKSIKSYNSKNSLLKRGVKRYIFKKGLDKKYFFRVIRRKKAFLKIKGKDKKKLPVKKKKRLNLKNSRGYGNTKKDRRALFHRKRRNKRRKNIRRRVNFVPRVLFNSYRKRTALLGKKRFLKVNKKSFTMAYSFLKNCRRRYFRKGIILYTSGVSKELRLFSLKKLLILNLMFLTGCFVSVRVRNLLHLAAFPVYSIKFRKTVVNRRRNRVTFFKERDFDRFRFKQNIYNIVHSLKIPSSRRFKGLNMFRFVHLFLFSVFFKNPRLLGFMLSKLVKKNIKSFYGFFRILSRRVFPPLVAFSNLNGLKIQFKGRLGRSLRKRKMIINVGSMPAQTIDASMHYICVKSTTIYGICGIKIWYYY